MNEGKKENVMKVHQYGYTTIWLQYFVFHHFHHISHYGYTY